ncbi:MAG TPA: PfkB family carbohydrate kinase [Actinophytocola sp.]|uniref:PfkB family carbohydrate kinase n=1 Tax=Actinophytocola sp. TaxID=1872138 RepID=UPI002DDD211D|nr:PfkB family carbohydrate kinase [Actinophytocola sp.]HEV2778905.1 PfkB family carbohydrate kinase [Actinophytocola sp.]
MRLAVVGDCLLDIDLVGSVNRLCPDAPAPVLDLDDERVRAGGAGLAARLAAADGVPVTLVSSVAGDQDGQRLREQLAGIPAVLGPSRRSTPAKTRLLAGGRSIARIDRGGKGKPPAATDDMLDAVRDADAVLVSDYGHGLTGDDRLRGLLAALAGRIPVVWDPHPRGADPVAGVAVATPNLAEATGSSTVDGQVLEAAGRAAALLRTRWQARAVAVTLGARGALVRDNGVSHVVPARQVTSTDPCGAGDRFAAVLATRLMAGDRLIEATRTAVEESGRFLAAGGVASIGREPRPDDELAVGLTAARRLAASVRARGGTVVATGGCFDLLHAGHARTLRAARELGDCLIVCVNSDDSVHRLKGDGRPINGQDDRAELLRTLGCVDAVVIFNEDGPERVLAELRPDLWVKGGDYSPAALPEADLVGSWGGEIVVTPYHDGRSTTHLAGALLAIS